MESRSKEEYRAAVWLNVELVSGWDGIFPSGFDKDCSEFVIDACFEGGIAEQTVARVIMADLLAHGASLDELSENDADSLRALAPVAH